MFVKYCLNCSLYFIFEIVFHIPAAAGEELEFSSYRVPPVLTFLVLITLFLVFLVGLYKRERREEPKSSDNMKDCIRDDCQQIKYTSF